MEILKETAIILGYIAEIIAFVIAAYKVAKKFDKRLETIESHMTENYIDIKRLTFVSKDMPIGERLDAGEKYVNAGGNGEVKSEYIVLKEEHEEELRKKYHLEVDKKG